MQRADMVREGESERVLETEALWGTIVIIS